MAGFAGLVRSNCTVAEIINTRESTMTIYAIFLCIYGTCSLYQNAYGEPAVFHSLSECQKTMRSYVVTPLPDSSPNRIHADKTTWWECRSKHVDAWEPAQ